MRYLLIVIIFIIGFSALPVWAMDCYAEHEGGNTVVIGYVPRISVSVNRPPYVAIRQELVT